MPPCQYFFLCVCLSVLYACLDVCLPVYHHVFSLSACLLVCLSVSLHVCMPVFQHVFSLSASMSVSMHVYLHAYQYVCLLHVCQSVCLNVCQSASFSLPRHSLICIFHAVSPAPISLHAPWILLSYIFTYLFFFVHICQSLLVGHQVLINSNPHILQRKRHHWWLQLSLFFLVSHWTTITCRRSIIFQNSSFWCLVTIIDYTTWFYPPQIPLTLYLLCKAAMNFQS